MTLLRKLAIALFTFATSTAFAADGPYPSKEIRFVVPASPGGSNDIVARALARVLADDGYRLIVDNIPGATGLIGLSKVASAAPDGYTLGMSTSSTFALVNERKIKLEQFTNIAVAAVDPLMLLVPQKGPATLEAFIDHMKKNPGKVSIATPGQNNVNHMFAVMAARVAGTEFVHVPYPGGARVLTDLAGSQLDAGVLKPSESKAQIEGKLVRPIAVFAEKRLAEYPNVPTFKEKGFDVFPYGQMTQMSYVVGPAALPVPVRDKLVAAFRKAIQSDQYQALARETGFSVIDVTGQDLDQSVDRLQKTFNVVTAKAFK